MGKSFVSVQCCHIFFIALCYIQLLFSFICQRHNRELLIPEILEYAAIIFIQTHFASIIFFHTMVIICINVITYTIFLIATDNQFYLIFIITFSLLELSRCHNAWKLYIEKFNSLMSLDHKKSEKDTLLHNLLPAHILTKFYLNNQA